MMMAAVLCLSVFAMTSYAGAVYTEPVDGITVTYGDPDFSSDGFILRYVDDSGVHDLSLLSSNINMSGSSVTAMFDSGEIEFSAKAFLIGYVCEIPLTYSSTPSSVTCQPVIATTGSYYYLDSNYDQQAFSINDDSAVHLLDNNNLLVTVWQEYELGPDVQALNGVLGNSITFDVSGLVTPVAGSGGSGSDEDDGEGELMGTDMDQLLQDTGTVASTTLSVVSSAVTTITENPFLLMTAGLLLLGAAVGILRRLLNRG